MALQLGHSDTDSFDYAGDLVYAIPRRRTSRSRTSRRCSRGSGSRCGRRRRRCRRRWRRCRLGNRSRPARDVLDLRRAHRVHDHDHLPTFEQRHALDHAVLLELVAHREEERAAAVGVGHLTSAEADGHLQLVALVQEALGGLDLRLDVVVVDLRRHPDLFPGDGLLLLLGVLGLLLLLVAVLPEIEDLRDRRRRVRRDLDEVPAFALRERERARGRNDAQLGTVGADEADGGDADLVVDAELGSYRLELRVEDVLIRPKGYHLARRRCRCSFVAGPSSAMTPNTTLGRSRPAERVRPFRSSASFTAPTRRMAFCERSLRLSVWSQTRFALRVSKAWVNRRSFASVFTGVRRAPFPYHV